MVKTMLIHHLHQIQTIKKNNASLLDFQSLIFQYITSHLRLPIIDQCGFFNRYFMVCVSYYRPSTMDKSVPRTFSQTRLKESSLRAQRS
jgi:hypothetical protein